MKRTLAAVCGVVLVLGGCPGGATQQEPIDGVVSVLTAGAYDGTLRCGTVQDDDSLTNQHNIPGNVEVGDAGSLKLYSDVIAPGIVMQRVVFGTTFLETVESVTESGDTVEIRTAGSVSNASGTITTARQVTLRQVDDGTIEMIDESTNTQDSGETATNRCTGELTR